MGKGDVREGMSHSIPFHGKVLDFILLTFSLSNEVKVYLLKARGNLKRDDVVSLKNALRNFLIEIREMSIFFFSFTLAN